VVDYGRPAPRCHFFDVGIDPGESSGALAASRPYYSEAVVAESATLSRRVMRMHALSGGGKSGGEHADSVAVTGFFLSHSAQWLEVVGCREAGARGTRVLREALRGGEGIRGQWDACDNLLLFR